VINRSAGRMRLVSLVISMLRGVTTAAGSEQDRRLLAQ
jgi:hypothetical protein